MTNGRWESGINSTSFLPLGGLFRPLPPHPLSEARPTGGAASLAVASLAKTLLPPASPC